VLSCLSSPLILHLPLHGAKKKFTYREIDVLRMNSKKKLPSMSSKNKVIALKNVDGKKKGNELKGITPIGFVCSPYRNTNDIPIKRGISRIKILGEYVPGLDGLVSSSHVIVIGYLHVADRQALKATPRPEEVGPKERGIFSVR